MTATFNPQGFSAVLMGDESLTIACGDMMLSGGHQLVGVVTRDDAVRQWATGHGLTVLEAPRNAVAQGVQADWILSIANLRMIPRDMLALAGKGAINFHDGPLPVYAGLNTPAWAIINQEARHGVSWHMIEGGVDEGDLLAQQMIDIAPDETAFSLNSKCYAAGMESFAAVLAQLETGTLDRTPQDLNLRSYFARDIRPQNMGVLDFNRPAEALEALVRGLDFGSYWNPLTVPKLAVDGDFWRVGSLEVLSMDQGGVGEILAVTDDSVTVGTSSGAVMLKGLTDLNGDVAIPTARLSVGDSIAPTSISDWDVTSEQHWRAVMSGCGAMALPFVQSSGTSGVKAQYLTVPPGVSDADIAAAAALALLSSGDADSGWLAVAKPEDHPLAMGWVPLRVTAAADEAVNAAIDRIKAENEDAQARSGVVCDLGLRDPELADSLHSQIALSFGDTPLPHAALTLCVTDGSGRLHWDCTYLGAPAVGLLAARVEVAIARLGSAQTCADLCALPESEEHILRDWNDTDRAYDPSPIHIAFEAQVKRTPNADALVCEGETLSYAALNAAANRLAQVLRDAGTTPGTPVGLYLARGIDLVIGALGILKAGGAYVPLDPGYPADRVAHYIADSAAPLIVSHSTLSANLPTHQAQVIEVDTHSGLAQASSDNPANQSQAEDLAYLIYTSGSTGTPKGVMVSHGNVANFFAGMDDRIPHKEGDVWLAVTSLSFDISV